jgi:hypothetical protein
MDCCIEVDILVSRLPLLIPSARSFILVHKLPIKIIHHLAGLEHHNHQQITTMSNPEPEADAVYTVFIRLPFPRGDFVDPPSVCDFVHSQQTSNLY